MTKQTLKLSREEAHELRCEAIDQKDISRHRWYTTVEIVAQHDTHGLIRFTWLRPASEIQDGQDQYDYDVDGRIDAVAVVKYEETITRSAYRPLNAGQAITLAMPTRNGQGGDMSADDEIDRALRTIGDDTESTFSVYESDDTSIFVLRGAPPRIRAHVRQSITSLLRDPRMVEDVDK